MRRRADGQWCAGDSAQVATAARTGRLAPRAASARALARRILRVVRQVVGAPDYERYLEHHARCHAGAAPLDRRAFYAEFVNWRFGPGPKRCC